MNPSSEIRTILDRADEAQSRNDWAGARAILELATREHPAEIDLLVRYATALRYCDRYADAIAVLKKALTLAPGHFDAMLELAAAHRLNFDKWEAIATANRLVEQFPDDPDARESLAICDAAFGEPARALPVVERLVSEHPNRIEFQATLCMVLVKLGRYTEAILRLNVLVETAPDFYQCWMLLVEANQRLLRTSAWMTAARRACEIAPAISWSHHLRYQIFLEEKNFSAAVDALHAATNQHPRLIDAYIDLGSFFWRGNDPAHAHEAFAHAVDLAPWYGPAVGMLAQFRADTGIGPTPDYGLLEKMALSTPYDRLPYFLGRLYFATLRDYEKAARFLNLAVECAPEDVDALRLAGEAHKMRDEYDAAIHYFERATSLCPEFAAAWDGLGFSLVSVGRYTDGAAAYEKAAALSPDDANVLHGHGDALLRAGRAEAAVPVLRRASALAEGDSGILVTLAFAQESAGLKADALATAQKALRALPDDTELHALVQRLTS